MSKAYYGENKHLGFPVAANLGSAGRCCTGCVGLNCNVDCWEGRNREYLIGEILRRDEYFSLIIFNKSAATDCSFGAYLNEDRIDVGTGRDGEDANDTTVCQHLQIRQMDQSACSPGCELCTAAEYIQSNGNARRGSTQYL